ncbi:hypothetical protein QBC34DRAFT_417516 [Podospora aff. communis PSN243]|uniref:MARVEL domain-containing protein n=1 Tax=Podospora aff. communis PSN243 TaxID=3040156 RepID=A0AAV9G5N3_9PEZI|nr:hypothetical protein QBC34DRAFT_417516 [Podospora aff. communis PSN243]
MPHQLNHQSPPLPWQSLTNTNQAPPADVVQTYNGLTLFRAASAGGGVLFSIPSASPWPARWHLMLVGLAILEVVTAAFSRTQNLRNKRIWTIANIVLYFSSVAVLVACFRVDRSHDAFQIPPIMLLIPDAINLGCTFAAFFTLPMLRIKNWGALPTDDGHLVGDDIGVEYHDEEEAGALAAAFRAQQEEQAPNRDERPR